MQVNEQCHWRVVRMASGHLDKLEQLEVCVQDVLEQVDVNLNLETVRGRDGAMGRW